MITRFALKNSRTVVFSMILMVLFGAVLMTQQPRLEDPFIVIREALITTKFPGMSPERVERLITRVIEEQARTMSELNDIWSTSKRGESIIHFEVADEVPAAELPATWKRLRNKLHDITPRLPEGTIAPVVNDEFGDTAVATVALWSDGFTMAEMREVARDAREHLGTMKGIKKIDLYGVQDETIYLDIINAKLSQFGIGVRTIADTLRAQNVTLPGGRLDVEGTEIIVEPTGNFNQISEIESLLIPIPGTQHTVPLQDLATIRRAYEDPPVKPAYYNGNASIILSVTLQQGVNAVEFGNQLTKELEGFEQSLPVGYVLEYATYQPELIQKAVNGAVINVMETLVIVLVVVMVFLGVRTGMIVGSFVPLVMLMGLVIMGVMGIELQRMSIASMIIALGMLVDNGIVVAEDIRTRMQLGATAKEAAQAAGNSLSLPLLTSTLTTVLAFTPMMLMVGQTGDYVLSLGQVVTILLLSSWFLSMYLTTSTSSWFMKVKPVVAAENSVADPYQGKFYRIYRGLLETALRKRIVVIGMTIGALALALFGFTFIPQVFFPPGDRNQFLAYLDFPAGTRIDHTAATVEEISDWLGNESVNPEITGTVAYVGNGGPRFYLSLSPDDPDPHTAFVIINTETDKQVPDLVRRTRDYLLANFPNVRGRVKGMWMGSSETGLLEFRLSGPNGELLRAQADQLMEALHAIPGTIDIRQDWNNLVFKLVVEVDQARARRAGLTSQEVNDSLDTFIDGSTTTEYRAGDTVFPVVVRGVEHERENLVSVPGLGVYSKTSHRNVPLSQIANLYGMGEVNQIHRYNQERTITVSAKHQTLPAGEMYTRLLPNLNEMAFPPGHYWEMGGELEDSADAQAKLTAWFPPCFLLIIALLIWQFNSFRRAGIIVITIPLILIGAVVGMLIMRADFGFMVILGLLSLAGTIINNGIVLIDKIETNRSEGNGDYGAVVAAAVSRFRPIMMSMTTTVLGLLPLIISQDPLFYGLACVMAWGLAIGTVFTLVVVPTLYTLFFGVPIPGRRKAAVQSA
jgi:multidrug efflux pump subunit AcrB